MGEAGKVTYVKVQHDVLGTLLIRSMGRSTQEAQNISASHIAHFERACVLEFLPYAIGLARRHLLKVSSP